MTLLSLSGGAVLDDTALSVTVRIVDDGDVSPPAAPRKPILIRSTGGVLELSTGGIDPSNTGGEAETIQQRTLFRVLADGGRELVPSLVTGLKQASTYRFVAVVSNSRYKSPESPVLTVVTTRATPPSSPLALHLTMRTGGMLQVGWNEPQDLGGVDLHRYVILVYSTAADGSVRSMPLTARVIVGGGFDTAPRCFRSLFQGVRVPSTLPLVQQRQRRCACLVTTVSHSPPKRHTASLSQPRTARVSDHSRRFR